MSASGINFEWWRKAARRPADDSDGSRREQRHSCGKGMTRKAVELQSDTAKAAAAPPTVGISKRRGGGGRAWGGRRKRGRPAQRPKFGSGHHRVGVCGPSNGRKKLA